MESHVVFHSDFLFNDIFSQCYRNFCNCRNGEIVRTREPAAFSHQDLYAP